jgi:purine-binding chemotaxis protein CheW
MSNKPLHILSGEEALDDYFTSLLAEEWEEQAGEPSVDDESKGSEDDKSETDKTEESVKTEESAVKVPELQTQLHAEYNASYNEVEYADLEAPDLEDIQKLLDKLEALNTSTEADISTILETESKETVVEDVQRDVVAVEEIQEWDVTALKEESVAEATVSEPETEVIAETVSEEIVETEEVISEEVETELATAPGAALSQNWESTQREEDFQVLYFDVDGVTFAVPLDELGGIHRIGELSHLIGRPDWYLGLQTNKDNQLDVVDTAKWVMAERLTDDTYKDSYQYVVMLGESLWGLASTQLMGTELLNTDKVRWRETAGKRPWLAGMVKEKMCALIHVEAMISMLNAGLDVKALN